MPGLTHQGHLDTFWANPTVPEPGVYSAFRRVLVDRSLVRGGAASESAVEALIQSMLERLGIGGAGLERDSFNANAVYLVEPAQRRLPRAAVG